jgi:hypothetical protein
MPDRPHWGRRWGKILDTMEARMLDAGAGESVGPGGEVRVGGRSVVLWQRLEEEPAGGS